MYPLILDPFFYRQMTSSFRCVVFLFASFACLPLLISLKPNIPVAPLRIWVNNSLDPMYLYDVPSAREDQPRDVCFDSDTRSSAVFNQWL